MPGLLCGLLLLRLTLTFFFLKKREYNANPIAITHQYLIIKLMPVTAAVFTLSVTEETEGNPDSGTACFCAAACFFVSVYLAQMSDLTGANIDSANRPTGVAAPPFSRSSKSLSIP